MIVITIIILLFILFFGTSAQGLLVLEHYDSKEPLRFLNRITHIKQEKVPTSTCACLSDPESCLRLLSLCRVGTDCYSLCSVVR